MAWIAYFKGLMHAADARLCVGSECWIPAAVSLYYAMFDLTAAALFASDYNEKVKWREYPPLPFSDAVNESISRNEDPMSHISHKYLLGFAKRRWQEFADTFEMLQKLREFSSYRPRMTFPDGMTPFVEISEQDAPVFIRTVQEHDGKLEMYFGQFRQHLLDHRPRHVIYGQAFGFIEQVVLKPIEELGRYRHHRAVTLARELHFAVFPPNEFTFANQ